jgi:hypothetical protein
MQTTVQSESEAELTGAAQREVLFFGAGNPIAIDSAQGLEGNLKRFPFFMSGGCGAGRRGDSSTTCH